VDMLFMQPLPEGPARPMASFRQNSLILMDRVAKNSKLDWLRSPLFRKSWPRHYGRLVQTFQISLSLHLSKNRV